MHLRIEVAQTASADLRWNYSLRKKISRSKRRRVHRQRIRRDVNVCFWICGLGHARHIEKSNRTQGANLAALAAILWIHIVVIVKRFVRPFKLSPSGSTAKANDISLSNPMRTFSLVLRPTVVSGRKHMNAKPVKSSRSVSVPALCRTQNLRIIMINVADDIVAAIERLQKNAGGKALARTVQIMR